MPPQADGLNDLDSMRQRRTRTQERPTIDARLEAGPKRPRPGGRHTLPTAQVTMAIPVKQIDFDPENRKSENIFEDPDTRALANSMRIMGQIQAGIVVTREAYLRKWPQHADGLTRSWVIMVGNRRKAAIELNAGPIPDDEEGPTMEVTTRKEITEDLTKLSGIAIHENLHRKDNNPMDLARWLAEEMPNHGNSQTALAEFCGRSQAWVSQLLSLLELIPELQTVVEAREITATTGRKLAQLDKDGQRAVLSEIEGLDAEARADFWATFGRTATGRKRAEATPDDESHKSFIEPGAEEEPAPKRRPIVIRISGEWSAPTVVKSLRESLTDDQWGELVREIRASA